MDRVETANEIAATKAAINQLVVTLEPRGSARVVRLCQHLENLRQELNRLESIMAKLKEES